MLIQCLMQRQEGIVTVTKLQIGSFVIGLAPHTSAAITARIIGFSKTMGLYAHPMFNAATRRDCDGDEASDRKLCHRSCPPYICCYHCKNNRFFKDHGVVCSSNV